MLKPVFDCSKTYGLVLEGGGAKGAYQIGVWKAFLEHGIRISAIAGSSVGALNAAMIAMGDFDEACALWQNVSNEDIFSQEQGILGQVLKAGGIDVEPMQRLIRSKISADKIKNSGIELYVVTVEAELGLEGTGIKEKWINLNMLSDSEMTAALMASASFPGFKTPKIKGKTYLDGGMVNNVPIDVLTQKGYKDIIVVRLYGVGVNKEPFMKLPEDVQLYKLKPSKGLGPTLRFDPERADFNMRLGYTDALRFLYGID